MDSKRADFPLKQALPDDVAAVARAHLGDPAECRIILRADMIPDGTFGDAWFLFADTCVGVIARMDGPDPRLLLTPANCRFSRTSGGVLRVEIADAQCCLLEQVY